MDINFKVVVEGIPAPSSAFYGLLLRPAYCANNFVTTGGLITFGPQRRSVYSGGFMEGSWERAFWAGR